MSQRVLQKKCDSLLTLTILSRENSWQKNRFTICPLFLSHLTKEKAHCLFTLTILSRENSSQKKRFTIRPFFLSQLTKEKVARNDSASLSPRRAPLLQSSSAFFDFYIFSLFGNQGIFLLESFYFTETLNFIST